MSPQRKRKNALPSRYYAAEKSQDIRRTKNMRSTPQLRAPCSTPESPSSAEKHCQRPHSSKNAAQRDSCNSGHLDRARAQGMPTTKSLAGRRVRPHRDAFYPRVRTDTQAGTANAEEKPGGASSVVSDGGGSHGSGRNGGRSENIAQRDSCHSGHLDRARAQGMQTTKSLAGRRVRPHRDAFYPPHRVRTDTQPGTACMEKKQIDASGGGSDGSEGHRDPVCADGATKKGLAGRRVAPHRDALPPPPRVFTDSRKTEAARPAVCPGEENDAYTPYTGPSTTHLGAGDYNKPRFPEATYDPTRVHDNRRERDIDLDRIDGAKQRTHSCTDEGRARSAPTNLPVAGEIPAPRYDEWASTRKQSSTRRKGVEKQQHRVPIPSALRVAGNPKPQHLEHAHGIVPCVLPHEAAHECQPGKPLGSPADVPWQDCVEDHDMYRKDQKLAAWSDGKVFDDYVDVARQAGGIPSKLPPGGGPTTIHHAHHSGITPCLLPYNADCKPGHRIHPEVEPYRYQEDKAMVTPHAYGGIPTAHPPAGQYAGKYHCDEHFPPERERVNGEEADRARAAAAHDAREFEDDVDHVRLRGGIPTNLPPGGNATKQHMEHRYGIVPCTVPHNAECKPGHAIAPEQDPTRFHERLYRKDGECDEQHIAHGGIASALPAAGKYQPQHAEHTTGIVPCAVPHDADPCEFTQKKPSVSPYLSDPRGGGDEEEAAAHTTALPPAGRPRICHREHKHGIAPCVVPGPEQLGDTSECEPGFMHQLLDPSHWRYDGVRGATVNASYAGLPCYLRHLPPPVGKERLKKVENKENVVKKANKKNIKEWDGGCGDAVKASKLPPAGTATKMDPYQIAEGVCPLAPGAQGESHKRRHRHQRNDASQSCNASTVSRKTGPPSTIPSTIMDTVYGNVPLRKKDNAKRRTISPSGHHGQCKCKLCTCRRHACVDADALSANGRRKVVRTAQHLDGPFMPTTTHRTDFRQPGLPNGGVTNENVKYHDAPRRRLPNNVTGDDGPMNTRHTTQRIDYRWVDLPFDPARRVHARKTLPLLTDGEKYPLVTTTTHRSDFVKQPIQTPFRPNFNRGMLDLSHGDPGRNDTTYRADYVPKRQAQTECPVVAIERKCKAPPIPQGRKHIFYDRKTQRWY